MAAVHFDEDPKRAQVFSQRLAADPEARLALFTRRHPPFDERPQLDPVLGVDQPPADR